jgi:cytochrome c-type biogenesis protein CcmH
MRRLGWLALLVVLGVALVVGTTDRDEPTEAERVDRIGRSVMCPTCAGQSVADSQTPAAVNVRREIARRVAEGETDGEIRDALAATFGERIILTPPRSGVAGLVWVLPVAALVGALAALALVFRRWRAEPDAVATPDDVAAAERARRAAHVPPPDPS